MKRKIFLILCFSLFAFSNIFAQERYVKFVDDAKKDASFLAFRTKLIDAVKRRDAKYVLSIVDPNISNTYGDDDGIRYFKKHWKIENPESKFWDEFSVVINNGGTFSTDGGIKIFSAPYTFSSFPEDLGSFDYLAVFGNNVNLRSEPAIDAPVVGKLSYNVVTVDFEDSVKDPKEEDVYLWYKVATLGGKKGFVKAEYIRSPLDYRAGFEKKNGRWMMIFFIAGD